MKPTYCSYKKALEFLEASRAWVAGRLENLPPQIPLVEGAEIPVLGVPHVLSFKDASRATVWVSETTGNGPRELVVKGPEARWEQILVRWLRHQLKAALEVLCARFADEIDCRIAKITLKEMRSQWGSCASDGRLTFSWRLVFAPTCALEYLAAHEVAHLLEMNHSPDFWATVERLLPGYHKGKGWMKRHGRSLFAYGG